MSDKELNAYIDEAGDEGFRNGASQWFVISSVAVDKSNDRDVARVINNVKARLWGECNKTACALGQATAR